MSEEEFFNRLLNKIAKEFGYDAASTLELMFMTKEKKIEQLENIRKEAIEYNYKLQENYSHGALFEDKIAVNVYKVAEENLNILNKGSDEDVNITN